MRRTRIILCCNCCIKDDEQTKKKKALGPQSSVVLAMREVTTYGSMLLAGLLSSK